MSSAWRYPFALLGVVFVLIGIAVWPRHQRIPVLIYHDIATSSRPSDAYSVEAALLSRELDHLKQNGYTPLTFETARETLENGRLPKHPILLTFDDALPGQFSEALPLLKTRGMTATFFITSDLVGDGKHMTWSNVRAIADAGMEIGGHSKTHAHLLALTDAQLTDEIIGDKTNTEREIGHVITVFAYPFQEHDARTDAIVVRAGYTITRDDTRFKSTVMTNSFDAFLNAI